MMPGEEQCPDINEHPTEDPHRRVPVGRRRLLVAVSLTDAITARRFGVRVLSVPPLITTTRHDANMLKLVLALRHAGLGAAGPSRRHGRRRRPSPGGRPASARNSRHLPTAAEFHGLVPAGRRQPVPCGHRHRQPPFGPRAPTTRRCPVHRHRLPRHPSPDPPGRPAGPRPRPSPGALPRAPAPPGPCSAAPTGRSPS